MTSERPVCAVLRRRLTVLGARVANVRSPGVHSFMLVCGRKLLAVVTGEREGEGERERGREGERERERASQPQTQTQPPRHRHRHRHSVAERRNSAKKRTGAERWRHTNTHKHRQTDRHTLTLEQGERSKGTRPWSLSSPPTPL